MHIGGNLFNNNSKEKLNPEISFDDDTSTLAFTLETPSQNISGFPDLPLFSVEEKKQAATSLRSLIISFIAGTVGSGWLALPKAFSIYGILLGCILCFTALINSAISIKMMAKLMNKYKKCECYADLVEKILGPRAKKALSIIFMINLFGSLIAYSLIASSFLGSLIENPLAYYLGYLVEDPHFQNMLKLSVLGILLVGTIPLQLLTNTGIFARIGMFTVFTQIFVVYVVIEQAPEYSIQTKAEIKLVNLDQPLLMLQNFGLWTFNLYLLDPIFLMKKDMGKVTEKRILITGVVSLFSVAVPYVLFGIVGYLSVGEMALGLDLFVDRLALPGSPDMLMTIVKALLVGVIMIAYLVRFIAQKLQVFNSLGKALTRNYNILYTFAILIIPSTIGFIYPAVNDWIGLIGAFCMTTLGTTFPALMVIKEMKKSGKGLGWIWAVRSWGAFFTAMGYISAVCIILKMIHVTQ